ncbi:glycine betaine/L-proline ABC transporter substrate-binding protein ProX, partial [Desulforhopalus singaporensis]
MKRALRKLKSVKKSMAVGAFMLLAFGCNISFAAMPGEGKTVQPCYTSIIEELFQLLVINKGLEKLGYEVKTPLELEITAMHLAVAQGDADFDACMWIPLHNNFYEKIGGASVVSVVGPYVEGAVQGYLIDKKTADQYNIRYLNDLADPKLAKLFDHDGDGKADLTGCNAGWGCERTIEHHLDTYKLRDTVTDNQGSYFALMADTIARYKAGEPVLYYTFFPSWIGSVLVPDKDVVWLEVTHTDLPKGEEGVNTITADGKNLGFSVNTINVLANNKFLNANPAAKRLFELVKI